MDQVPLSSTVPWLSQRDEVFRRIQKQMEHLVSIRLPTPLAAWMPDPAALRSFIEVAFWASLRTNEERPTRVRLALAPRSLVPTAFAFASPVDFAEAQVAKLAHVLYPWVGQVLHWWPTPWRAVQEAAWRALTTSVVEELTDETPR